MVEVKETSQNKKDKKKLRTENKNMVEEKETRQKKTN